MHGLHRTADLRKGGDSHRAHAVRVALIDAFAPPRVERRAPRRGPAVA